MIVRTVLVAVAAVFAACSNTPRSVVSASDRSGTRADDARWLEDRAMLARAAILAREYSGTYKLWAHPYAEPRPRDASTLASVWFTAYPAATITRPNESVLATLGGPELWRAFKTIGIHGIHTGPMKRAGGIRGRDYTPTIDGNFDRISSDIDPRFGSETEYRALVRTAHDVAGAIVVGDIIPGHSGKGADFRLAELGYKDYPGLYHMVEIPQADWSLLPRVPSGSDSVNLSPDAVDRLHAKGYIVGQLPRTIFYQKGVKDTDWSATDVVVGVDGKSRRWVYLHYFKAGQPTFNWLDPSFAAQRLVIGDALESIGTLGERGLRLDANGFLGIEVGAPGQPVWSEGHPLSVTSNQLIAGMVRKLGGFTFQELNLTLEDIKAMSRGGADLTYDFITRPAYEHALVTGDAEFLRLMLGLERTYAIDPASLVHALQNHDELTLELVHFWTTHKNDTFAFHGKTMTGTALRDLVRQQMRTKLLAAPYNLEASNGVACTTVSLIAAALGIEVRDWSALSDAQRNDIAHAHVLLAMFNAMQPGVFALSGWDLVGAATLPRESVAALLADGDTRWINRGAYDLLGIAPDATQSASGLPRAVALYGALPEQLAHEGSFASRLARMLAARERYRVFASELVDVPAVKADGLVVMVDRLPDGAGIEVTALNFGRVPITETVAIAGAPADAGVADLIDGTPSGKLSGHNLSLALGPLDGRALVIR
jgi:trehalose synthase